MRAIGLILTLCVLPAPGRAQTPEERGRAIIDEADRRVSGYGDFTADLTMTLRDSDGAERVREMRILGLEVPEDGDKTLVIFDRPKDLRGTSILTVTHRHKRSDQWVYLPAIRRARRIASADQSDSFMGSEFTYEDVGSLEFDKYRYRFIRDETLDQTSTHVVERFPTDEESAYARQILWLDTREYRVLRIDYYDRGDRLVKSLSVEGYRQYARGQWRPDRMVMSDHRTGKSTTLDWHAYAFQSGLTDEDFDPLRLGRTR